MKMFAGLDRSDYQDVLRAIGRYLDGQRIGDLRLFEQDDGVLAHGRDLALPAGQFRTFRLRDSDLMSLLRKSYRLRGGGRQAPVWVAGALLSYQDRVRAGGRLLGDEGWGDFRLIEHPDGLVLQGHRRAYGPRAFQTQHLNNEYLRVLLSPKAATQFRPR